jgi:hypothetical protein
VISPDAHFVAVRDRNGIAMFGDSVLDTVDVPLWRMINSHGVNVAENAVSGRGTAAMAAALAGYADRGLLPSRLLVISGANDLTAPHLFEASVDRVLRLMGGRPVYWLTVYVEHWAFDGNRRARDAQAVGYVNGVLYRAAARYSNLVLVDWHRFLLGVPGSATPRCCRSVVTFPRPVDRLSDGVHPTPYGTAGIVALVESRIGWT